MVVVKSNLGKNALNQVLTMNMAVSGYEILSTANLLKCFIINLNVI